MTKDRIEDPMSLRLSTDHENARSALECGSVATLFPLCGTSELAVERCTVAWEARPRASSRDYSGSKLPHCRAPAAPESRVLSGRPALFSKQTSSTGSFAGLAQGFIFQ